MAHCVVLNMFAKILMGFPSMGASNTGGVYKFCDFLPNQLQPKVLQMFPPHEKILPHEKPSPMKFVLAVAKRLS